MDGEAQRFEVLHFDDEVVVVNKPGGILVHRSFEAPDRVFVLQELSRQLGRWLFPVHRLDRAASGVLAFALSSDAARRLQAAMGAADARKEYLALVRGLAPEAGAVDKPLKDERGEPQPARTEFRRLAAFSGCSLLEVRIASGRRHQIRRHLSHLAHQILGDSSYGKGRLNRRFREAYGLPRLFLHASRLDVEHPSGSGRLAVTAPLAQDLRNFLYRLPDFDPSWIEGL
jgi:tRNA pseudouridine65 synthase